MENKSQIEFTLPDPSYVPQENVFENIPTITVLKINKDGFYYMDEKVEDIHNVYKRFNEWLTKAEQVKN